MYNIRCLLDLLPNFFFVKDTEPKQWEHFQLNFPYYTNFTSPLRSYGDLIVHRLLYRTIYPDSLAVTEELIQRWDKSLKNRIDRERQFRKISNSCTKVSLTKIIPQVLYGIHL